MIWSFRERLAKTEKDAVIWDEFQRQLVEQGLCHQDLTIKPERRVPALRGHLWLELRSDVLSFFGFGM
jgi:IS5 family transposase